jgi:hypothetical protein
MTMVRMAVAWEEWEMDLVAVVAVGFVSKFALA